MHPTSEAPAHVKAHEETIRARALAYPETREDRPWDHAAFKVRGKTFCFLVADATGLSLSMKLPDSSAVALMLPFAQPTGYGLGRSGWVSAQFGVEDDVPVAMLLEWLDESYRAVAPKTLVKALGAGAPAPATATKVAVEKAPGKKTAPNRASRKSATAKTSTAKTSTAKTSTAKTSTAKTSTAKTSTARTSTAKSTTTKSAGRRAR